MAKSTMQEIRIASKHCGIGKLVYTNLYVHRSLLLALPGIVLDVVLEAQLIAGQTDYNIIKIAIDGNAVSFLHYPTFDSEAHPALAASTYVSLVGGFSKIRIYSDRNPPILHRKDAFVDSSYPHFTEFHDLTIAEEERGLLSRSDIGFRDKWLAFLAIHGVEIRDHQVIDSRISHLLK